MDAAIGIDLGGTRIKSVVVDDVGNILHQQYSNTNDDESAVWKNAVKESVTELIQKINDQETSIGISAPGLPSANNEAIAFMPGRMQ